MKCKPKIPFYSLNANLKFLFLRMRRHVLGKEMIQYFLKYKAEACRSYYITAQLKSVRALQKKQKKKT
jgi:hypothetical protein